MNGLRAVLNYFTVSKVWGSGLDTSLPGYEEFQRLINDRGVIFMTVSAGDVAHFDDTRIDVLHPRPSFLQKTKKPYAAENDRSLVIRMNAQGRTLLFAGDIHAEGETFLLRNVPNLSSDLVKVPHHGSRTSSTQEFIAAVRPAIAVATVGEGNLYRHPAEDVVERYKENGVNLYRTDRDGAVLVRLGQTGLTVRTWSELSLQRITPSEQNGWWMVERENWNRVAIRTAGI